MRRPGLNPLFVLGAAAALLGGLAAAALATYEEIERGQLRDYTDEPVIHVRVLGDIDVYVTGEASNPPLLDVVNGDILIAAAGVCLFAWLLIRRTNAARESALFATACAGMAYLALDEQLGFHETIGHNLTFLADLPVVKRPDEVIQALYVVPTVAFLLVFRSQISASRTGAFLLLGALALFFVAGLADVGELGFEEQFEPVLSLTVLGSFAALAYDHVPRRVAAARG